MNDLLNECTSSNWLINIFQVTKDFWQVNLRYADGTAKGVGTGSSLLEAFENAKDGFRSVDLTTNFIGWHDWQKATPAAGQLLEELGLLKREPVRRI